MNKFENEVTEQLNEITLNGFANEEFGSVTENGLWTGLLVDTEIDNAPHAVLFEDEQGFVWSHIYKTEHEARSDFNYNFETYEEVFHPEARFL
jgi:hypothetical protein